jgi:kynurenine formamidase
VFDDTRRTPRGRTADLGLRQRGMHRFSVRRVVAPAVVAALMISLGAVPSASPATDPFLPGPARWGPADEAGNSNTQTPEKVLQAVKLIKTGKKYRLGHEYHRDMPTFPGNSWAMAMKPPTQVLRQVFNAEYLQGEVAQNGTQFDSLGHFGIQPQGSVNIQDARYYNGLTGSQVHGVDGLQRLGIENIKPFFTRAILLDVARYLNNNNVMDEGTEITKQMVLDTLAAQGMTEADIQEGDVVLFRTGWEAKWGEGTLGYYKGAPGIPGGVPGIGLQVARWLASKQVACVGADNWGVSVAPYPADSPEKPPADILEPVHNELIVRHGIPHQESMALSELAADAAKEKQLASGNGRSAYTFAYIFVPVPIRGASWSPGIPLAVK